MNCPKCKSGVIFDRTDFYNAGCDERATLIEGCLCGYIHRIEADEVMNGVPQSTHFKNEEVRQEHLRTASINGKKSAAKRLAKLVANHA